MEAAVVEKSRIGRIAALVAAVLYVLSAIHITIGTFVENGDVDGSTDDNGDIMFLIWGVLVFVATIAAVVAVWQLLKANGVLGEALAKAALLVGVIAIVVSFFCWLWPIWGVALGLSVALAALALRKHGRGIVGFPSSTDWAILVAWVVGVAVMYLLWITDLVEADSDGLDWGYTSGYLIGALITAIVLVSVAQSLRLPATVEPTPVETIEPTDGPGVAGI